MSNDFTEAQMLKAIRENIEEQIPFTRMLGTEVVSIKDGCPEVRVAMRPDLVGNFFLGRLHGGVIATLHDWTGGLVTFLAAQHRIKDKPLKERLEGFGRLGTIDLRVDYLRPGGGEWFLCKGKPLRAGSKVTVAQMEISDDAGKLISVATGAYVM